jgi:hypothetical protein
MTHFSSLKNLNKLVASLMVAALFAAAFMVSGSTAKADTTTGQLTLTGGAVTVNPSGFTFSDKPTFTGLLDDSTSGSFTLSVADLTGSNAGWKIQASMTLLEIGTTGHKLPAATIAVDSDVTVTTTNGDGSQTPTGNTVTYSPYTFSSAPTLFFTAAANSGQGNHTIGVNVQQDIPAYSYAGTYSSTLTVTIVSGP